MKFLLAVCVAICFAGVYCDTAPKAEEQQYVKDCAAKNSMDDKMVLDLKNSKTFMLNQNTMCFTACLMEHNGLMNAEGKIMDKFMKSPHANDCKSMSGKDKCETAAKVMDCMMNKEGVMLSDINL